jgi:hypothetical protein
VQEDFYPFQYDRFDIAFELICQFNLLPDHHAAKSTVLLIQWKTTLNGIILSQAAIASIVGVGTPKTNFEQLTI